MGLQFAVAVMDLCRVAAITVLVTLEKLLPWPRHLCRRDLRGRRLRPCHGLGDPLVMSGKVPYSRVSRVGKSPIAARWRAASAAGFR